MDDDLMIVPLAAPLPEGLGLDRQKALSLVDEVVVDRADPHRIGKVTAVTGFSFPHPTDPSERVTVWTAAISAVDTSRPDAAPERLHAAGAPFEDSWRVLRGEERDRAAADWDACVEAWRQRFAVNPTQGPSRRV